MYMAYIPLTIILSSCLGSVAAMIILMQDRSIVQVIELSICVIVCMAFNSSILAQMKAKIIFNLLITSLVLNSIIILFSLL